MTFEVREIIYGSKEYEAELQLRYRVLRQPLGLQFAPESLVRDGEDTHLAAFTSEDLLVGCLILSRLGPQTIKMRQVAVDFLFQGRGIGSQLVDFAEQKCRSMGVFCIELNARTTAISFYDKLGYEIFGDPLEEVQIPHRKMRKLLGP